MTSIIGHDFATLVLKLEQVVTLKTFNKFDHSRSSEAFRLFTLMSERLTRGTMGVNVRAGGRPQRTFQLKVSLMALFEQSSHFHFSSLCL